MFKRLLVALDGSECGERALTLALQMARNDGAEIVVCSAADPATSVWKYPPSPTGEQAIRLAEEEAQRVVLTGVVRAQAARIGAEGRVLVGPAAQAIVNEAARMHADTVIMGTHGRSGLRRLFMGSVAEAVLRASPCPVIVVRDEGLRETAGEAVS